jgi:hypothetical protein
VRGNTSLLGGGNIFRRWESGATLAVGDIIHIESPAPRSNREESKISAFSKTTTTTTSTIADPLRYDHAYPAVMRHRDFYPVLYVPEADVARPMLTHDHRISWSWECNAVLFQSWAAALAEQAEDFGGSTADSDEATDLDALMRSGTTTDVSPDGSGIVDGVHSGATGTSRYDPRVTGMYVPTWWRG